MLDIGFRLSVWPDCNSEHSSGRPDYGLRRLPSIHPDYHSGQSSRVNPRTFGTSRVPLRTIPSPYIEPSRLPLRAYFSLGTSRLNSGRSRHPDTLRTIRLPSQHVPTTTQDSLTFIRYIPTVTQDVRDVSITTQDDPVLTPFGPRLHHPDNSNWNIPITGDGPTSKTVIIVTTALGCSDFHLGRRPDNCGCPDSGRSLSKLQCIVPTTALGCPDFHLERRSDK